jgi:hypothetical protein
LPNALTPDPFELPYKDGEEFKDTPSLGFDDLANASKLLLDAESWVSDQIARDKAESSSANPASSRNEGRRR